MGDFTPMLRIDPALACEPLETGTTLCLTMNFHKVVLHLNCRKPEAG